MWVCACECGRICVYVYVDVHMRAFARVFSARKFLLILSSTRVLSFWFNPEKKVFWICYKYGAYIHLPITFMLPFVFVVIILY